MAKAVIMPALGMAQETGKIIQWLKTAGDSVHKDEPLLEIETDKATVEIEAPADGVLANITAFAGDEVPVGATIALVVAPGEAIPTGVTPGAATTTPSPAASAGRAAASPIAARIAAEHHIDLAQVRPSGARIHKDDVLAYMAAQRPAANGGRLPASPKARRLAHEKGLDLAVIAGSGPQGAVLAADVLAAAPGAPPEIFAAPAAEVETQAVSSVWRVMAGRVTASWTSVPHFYLLREVDATRLLAWHARAQTESAEKITYTDLLVKLVAAALRQHPRVNASWHDGGIALNTEVNVGLAVAVEDGLVVPVIHRADTLGLNAIAARRRELVTRAQRGKLGLDDLRDGTFTISNLGMYGVDAFNAIVNPPQAAILAVGRIAERVVPVDGQPGIRPMMLLSLSFDHRVVDGARGALFLGTLAECIEEPLRLLD